MPFETREPMEISCSGTLGDTFFVYCKLAAHHAKTGATYRLTRYTTYPEFDKQLSEFFSLVPFVEYVTPCVSQCSGIPGDPDWPPFLGIYINAVWMPVSAPWFPSDPPEFTWEPFPEIAIEPFGEHESRPLIGIQLNTGKLRTNYKGLSLSWVKELLCSLRDTPFDFVLTGTGEGYDLARVEKFCRANGIENRVGKTDFLTWLRLVVSMDVFITGEGFPAFFAMSQRIPTMTFVIDPSVITHMPPEWETGNYIRFKALDSIAVRVQNKLSRMLRGRIAHLRPFEIAEVTGFVERAGFRGQR